MLFKLLVWIFRERKKYKKPVEINLVENPNRPRNDNTDGKSYKDDPKLPRAYQLLCMWGIIETLVLAIVLITETGKAYGENFLYGLCSNGSCSRVVGTAIIYKIVCSLLLTIGAKTVRTFLEFSLVLFLMIFGVNERSLKKKTWKNC